MFLEIHTVTDGNKNLQLEVGEWSVFNTTETSRYPNSYLSVLALHLHVLYARAHPHADGAWRLCNYR